MENVLCRHAAPGELKIRPIFKWKQPLEKQTATGCMRSFPKGFKEALVMARHAPTWISLSQLFTPYVQGA